MSIIFRKFEDFNEFLKIDIILNQKSKENLIKIMISKVYLVQFFNWF